MHLLTERTRQSLSGPLCRLHRKDGADAYADGDFDSDFFKNITEVVNHGIYVASQSQVLERNSMEIWGNIILNGTDVLTITAVLGYVVQKFMEK